MALAPQYHAAPFYSLVRAAWIPYALTWDPETGALRGVEGPRGFDTYRQAVEAGRFLVISTSGLDMNLATS